MKSKKFDEVKPYVYVIIRKSDGLKYVGSRYGNVRIGLTPREDIGVRYFTSGKLRREFKKHPDRFYIRLLYTFENKVDTLKWEERFVKKVMGKEGWANVGWANNFYEIEDVGERISSALNTVVEDGKTVAQLRGEKVKYFAWNTEEGRKWREEISTRKKEFWQNLSEEEMEEIQRKRISKIDFEKANTVRARNMRNDICENGLNAFQRSSIKAAETRKLLGIDSDIGRKRNEKFNRKLCLMSEDEFKSYCEGRSPRIIAGWKTRRERYSHLYVTNTD